MVKSRRGVVILFASVFAIFVANKYVKLSTDKDSVYKVKLPEKMKVAHCVSNGVNDLYSKFYIDEKPLPKVGDNEVLVAVSVASFSQRDFEYAKGSVGSAKNKNKEKDFVPCSDFSGKVVGMGKNVKDYEIGDRVFGIADITKENGACAQYISVPRNNVSRIPYSLTDKQAASIPTPALLNWFAFNSLEKKGKKNGLVLIDDAISETGIMLTGLLVRNGFKVSAIDNKFVEGWALGFGIDDFIKSEEFGAKKASMQNKYDVVFNLRHGLAVKELLPLVKKGGEFVSFEDIKDRRGDIKIKVLNPELIDGEVFSKMARLVHLGKIQIKVAREFELSQIRDAYIRAKKGNLDGKVIVKIK